MAKDVVTQVERLAEILDRLNKGEDVDKARERARELLNDLSPAQLSMAEQRLIEEGLDPAALRELCTVHIDMVRPALEEMRAKLPGGHVIDTLVREHDAILLFLDRLEKAVATVRARGRWGEEEARVIRHAAEHLLEAEKHHIREEDVLMVEMERRGITGPPRIMRMEHDDLRPRKKRLKELAAGPCCDGEGHLDELDRTASYIIAHLRDHIFKENHILYPTALETITDPCVWADMKRRCDEIGYCCFTPGS